MDDFFGSDNGFFGSDNDGMSNDDSCGGGDSTPDDGASFSEAEFVGEPDMESEGVCKKNEGYFPFRQELDSNGYYLTINFDGSVTTSSGQIVCYVNPDEIGNVFSDDHRIIEGLKKLK